MCTLFRVFPQFGERELDSEVELREPAPDQQLAALTPRPRLRVGPCRETHCTLHALPLLSCVMARTPAPAPLVDSCWQRAAKCVLFPTSALTGAPRTHTICLLLTPRAIRREPALCSSILGQSSQAAYLAGSDSPPSLRRCPVCSRRGRLPVSCLLPGSVNCRQLPGH